VLDAAPSTTTAATDEVVDAIASIEILRQETEKQAGLAMSCSSALHRLQELHDHEKEGLRLRGPRARHADNVEALRKEIGRVKVVAGAARHGPAPRNEYRGEQKVVKGAAGAVGHGPAPRKEYRGEQKLSWHDASSGTGRSRGRRTMGRASGR